MWKCKKCNENLRKALMEEYVIEGIKLHDIEAYVCPAYRDYFFDERQIESFRLS